MKKKTIVILVILAAVIILAAWLILSAGKKELVMNTATVGTGTIETTVMATGYVQPVDQVEVGTQVSGVIERIYVDFNSQVTKGQLLAELDKSTLNERLIQSNASLNSMESNLTYARQNYDRIKRLHDVKAATDVALEEAQNALVQAQSSLDNARADVQQAKVNLSYANITSPIDGVVLERAVDEGQTVAASFNTPTLFTIANDLTKMQVEADVDEADIGRVRDGQRVTFTVDAYSNHVFEGTVNQIRLQPVVTNNVVTYTVIIEAPNPDEKLFPGMTANITIITESETGLVLPIEAFAFTMSPEVLSKINGTPQNGDENPSVNGMRQDFQLQGSKTVWAMTPQGTVQKTVQAGINDGVNAIVTSGITQGETVILSASMEKKSGNNGTASNPLMPQRPGGRR